MTTLLLTDKKKKELKLEPITHTLLKPITDEGKEITELTFQPLLRSIYVDVDVTQDEDEVVEEFALVLTGISAKAFDLLSSPDYNSVTDIVSRLVSESSSHWVPGLAIGNEKIQLALPIKGDDGRDIKDIELNVPSVKTRKIYKKLPTDEQKAAFITHSCSGLSEAEIGRMFMPDWNQLQANIDNFLNKRAGYFQIAM